MQQPLWNQIVLPDIETQYRLKYFWSDILYSETMSLE